MLLLFGMKQISGKFEAELSHGNVCTDLVIFNLVIDKLGKVGTGNIKIVSLMILKFP